MILKLWSICAGSLLLPLVACLPAFTPPGQPKPTHPGRPGEPGEPSGPRLSQGFTIHWMTTTDANAVRRGRDYSALFDFAGVPVQRDCAVLYEHEFAEEVRSKGFEVLRDPGYVTRLRTQLRAAMDQKVPDRNFRGIICLDIEFMVPWWGERTNGHGLSKKIPHGVRYHDAWAAYMERTQPDLRQRTREDQERILKQSYEAAVRDWYELVFQEARRLRPQAQLSGYGLPLGSRHDNDYAGPKAAEFRKGNDDVRWMIDVSDCILLPLYQDKIMNPGIERQVAPRRITVKQGREFIESNIAEARRLARGKRVYVLAMINYPDHVKDFEPDAAGRPLNKSNLDAMFKWPHEAGADGLIIWSHFMDEAGFAAQQREWVTRIAPILGPLAGE
jgi:hypothetical protein